GGVGHPAAEGFQDELGGFVGQRTLLGLASWVGRGTPGIPCRPYYAPNLSGEARSGSDSSRATFPYINSAAMLSWRRWRRHRRRGARRPSGQGVPRCLPRKVKERTHAYTTAKVAPAAFGRPAGAGLPGGGGRGADPEQHPQGG